jgi:hypothetical protein
MTIGTITWWAASSRSGFSCHRDLRGCSLNSLCDILIPRSIFRDRTERRKGRAESLLEDRKRSDEKVNTGSKKSPQRSPSAGHCLGIRRLASDPSRSSRPAVQLSEIAPGAGSPRREPSLSKRGEASASDRSVHPLRHTGQRSTNSCHSTGIRPDAIGDRNIRA